MAVATEIRLNKAERVLHVAFDDGARFSLPAEYLRVESPSAEVQGHGPHQKKIVPGKRDVGDHRRSSRSAITRCGWCSMICTTPGSIRGTTCTSWGASRTAAGRPTWRRWRRAG